MPRAFAALAIVAVLVGPRLAAAKGVEYGVVAPGAMFREAPRAKATGHKFVPVGHALGADVRVIEKRGDFYEVENLATARCHQSIMSLDDLAIRFFVHENHMLPVITEAISVDLGGTQRFEALPGALIENNVIRSRLGSVTLPKGLVRTGRTYEFAGDLFATASHRANSLRNITASFDDVSINPQPPTVGDAGPAREGRALFSAADPCLRVDLRVAESDIERSREGGFGFGKLGTAWSSSQVKKGTRLWWKGGRKAGRVRTTFRLGASQVVGSKTCFERGLGIETTLPLCVLSKRLIKASKKSHLQGVVGGVIGGINSGVIGRANPNGNWGHGTTSRRRRPAASSPLGRVQLGKTTVTGSLDRASVVKAIRVKSPSLTSCHTAGPPSKLPVDLVRVSLRIQPDATVEGVAIHNNTAGSTAFATCLKSAVQRIRFPKSPKGSMTRVRFHLRFSTP